MADRPNILLLFTDQQRFDTIAALGHQTIRTPNLDRLVNEGTAFTSAYSPSPVCVPARASLHSGQYPWNSGCPDNGFPMRLEGPSLQSLLADAGYRTHSVGKRHFAPDRWARWGFQSMDTQEEIPGRKPEDDYTKWLWDSGWSHAMEPHGVRSEMYYVPQVNLLPPEFHPSTWVADRSIDFLSSRTKHDEPFFLFSSFIHPHPPFSPPTPWHKCYRADDMPPPKLPPGSEHLRTWINRFQNRYKYRDQGWDYNLVRLIKAHYFACISYVDFQIGRILDELERTGIKDNTLILFASDHGELLGDYGSFGKRSFHDSCARIPMLARLPGRFAQGARCDDPVSLVDFMPTALSAAGATVPEFADGVDLSGVADGSINRDAVFSQFQAAGKAMWTSVTKEWKYVYSAPDERELLFDRVHDPDETRDRGGRPTTGDALAATRGLLVDRLRTDGATDVLDGDEFKRYGILDMPASPDAGHIIQEADDMFDVPGYA